MAHENFTNLVQASPTLAARWSELAQKAISDARDMGVQIDENMVLDVLSVRNAALGAPLDPEEYHRDLLALPALSDVAMKKAISEGDEDARAAAASEIAKMTEVPHARSTDARARAIARAREMGVAEGSPLSEVEEKDAKLRLLSEMDHVSRLAMGRKWGLL